MKSFLHYQIAYPLTLFFAVVAGDPAGAATIWTGPITTFSIVGHADPNLPANQDRITDNVWITRGDVQGIYNARSEPFYTHYSSPADTEWAFGTTADIGSLTFAVWETAVANKPPGSVGQDMVLHLITDDIYLDIAFKSWGQGSPAGGSFAYERSTASVPEPGSLVMVCALVLTIGRRRFLWPDFSDTPSHMRRNTIY